jgi:hypothetical protein
MIFLLTVRFRWIISNNCLEKKIIKQYSHWIVLAFHFRVRIKKFHSSMCYSVNCVLNKTNSDTNSDLIRIKCWSCSFYKNKVVMGNLMGIIVVKWKYDLTFNKVMVTAQIVSTTSNQLILEL